MIDQMSAKSKIRGYNVEIQIRDKHIAYGIPCERVPLSGSMGGLYMGDLNIPSVANLKFVLEVKARRNGSGFKVIEQWLENRDILFVKRNNQDPMVVMNFDLYLKLMKKYLNDTT